MKITKRQLRRIIREEYKASQVKRRAKRRLREDAIDTELDNLHKNIGDDIEHIRDLKDDIHADHEEEKHAEEERKDEAFRRRLHRIVRENTRPRRRNRRRRTR